MNITDREVCSSVSACDETCVILVRPLHELLLCHRAASRSASVVSNAHLLLVTGAFPFPCSRICVFSAGGGPVAGEDSLLLGMPSFRTSLVPGACPNGT